MDRILIDTGVWYSRYDSRDTAASREDVETIFWLVRSLDIVLPWPIAYETLRTRFTRNRTRMSLFEEELKSPRIKFVDDTEYRDKAIQLSFESSRNSRPLSMVDCVLRLMMDDGRIQIKYFATFNPKDFQDVCLSRGIEMLPD